jgi:hypothetical protein
VPDVVVEVVSELAVASKFNISQPLRLPGATVMTVALASAVGFRNAICGPVVGKSANNKKVAGIKPSAFVDLIKAKIFEPLGQFELFVR